MITKCMVYRVDAEMCLLALTQRTQALIPPEGKHVACLAAHNKVLPRKPSLDKGSCLAPRTG